MKKISITLIIISILILYSCVTSNTTTDIVKDHEAPVKAGEKYDLNADLPIGPRVLKAKLDNGLTYIIRENKTPESRAEFRLVVNAGSILEDDDQQGLAHFVEHMAFDGTRNFRKQAIVDFLESIGMRFGADLNAYTSYDETVYNLLVPTEKESELETAVRILCDWAFNVTFDPEEVEKERSVIMEEYYLRRDANNRIFEKQIDTLFNHSRYASRRPIGKPEIIQNCTPDGLKRFYRDWYRPDLITVIAVGDFDRSVIENLIKKYFSEYKAPENERKRPSYSLPDHSDTRFAIAQDKEATKTSINIVYKYDIGSTGKYGDYRRNIVSNLAYSMLNHRLDEIAMKKDPPFLGAYSGEARYVKTKDAFVLGAQVKEDGIARGFDALLTEAERVLRYGFTESELSRVKDEMLTYMKQAYNERDTSESEQYAREYIRHVTENESIPGIELEYDMYVTFLPVITLAEVNKILKEKTRETNRVIMVSAPEKDGLTIPTATVLTAMMKDVKSRKIEPYMDKMENKELLSSPPEPSRVVKEKEIKELGVTEWILANNVRVVLKPTQFKNDEILFTAYSPGGTSLAKDDKLVPAKTAAGIIVESGVGNFNATELSKLLSASTARVSPWIDALFEGIGGSSSPEDLETALKLVYLYFTSPRKDGDAFEVYRNKLESSLKNKESSPVSFFWDSVQKLLTQNHKRRLPMTYEMVKEMDLTGSYEFYRDRFQDAGDFTFIFVGNFVPEKIKPLVERYLGGLPAGNRKETFKDHSIFMPEGVVEKSYKKGTEQKSEVVIIFDGPYTYDYKTVLTFYYLREILDIEVREKTRDEKGGIYSSGVYFAPTRFPREEYKVFFDLSCEPRKVDDLTAKIFEIVEEFKKKGPSDTNFMKAREILVKERETEKKTNEFWRDILYSYYMQNNDLTFVNKFIETVKSITPEQVREIARRYLNTKRYIKAVLYPEDGN
ncbi:MAG: insulinase family protein [Spirochaetales bacterium]|nr:insulinase family protein [Spirochaetales bacterium]